jgi:hypothetical protein
MRINKVQLGLFLLFTPLVILVVPCIFFPQAIITKITVMLFFLELFLCWTMFCLGLIMSDKNK